MNAKELYEKLRPLQESKGYFFNSDLENMTLPLMESLLANKERYGYMACPCRLASGEYEKDRDILCPCVYREPDVEEYGACYCGLYVSKDVHEGGKPVESIPERRPVEKIFA